ncbi:TRAM domain-containing protein [Mariniluteicoccus endophyticus]
MTSIPPGELLGPVIIESVAHGGHCVARHDGRVLFVRHALPGEVVRVRVTDASQDRFWRADAVEVVEPAAGRVEPACPVARPGGCGGCDFQHADAATQRGLKRAVVAEQLERMAGVVWDGDVEGVAPVTGWRTRMRYTATGDGERPLGLRVHRSSRVVTVPETGCLIASGEPGTLPALGPGTPVSVVDAASGAVTLVGDDDAVVTERADGRPYSVDAQGFWQVHPRAADTLVSAVVAGLEPRAGERAFDLYCGVGLFAGALADRGAQVWGVEGNRSAIAHARTNVPGARFTAGRVEQVLNRMPRRTDLVVLDPPRAGAGRKVVTAVDARSPRAIAYVACDPAALGRDLATLLGLGWRMDGLRAFDLFPQTHHVECVAILRR